MVRRLKGVQNVARRQLKARGSIWGPTEPSSWTDLSMGVWMYQCLVNLECNPLYQNDSKAFIQLPCTVLGYCRQY